MMTAHRCLTSAGSIEGLTVLVTGASGRVGHYAVQMARSMGARVVATVGTDDDRADIETLGAEAVYNFRDDSHPQAMLDTLNSAAIDRVVDVEFGHNLARYLPLLKDNAVVASYASAIEPNPQVDFYALMFLTIFIHPVLVYSMPEAAKNAAKECSYELLAGDEIVHRINHTIPLERIADAHRLVESGARGAVIVTIGENA